VNIFYYRKSTQPYFKMKYLKVASINIRWNKSTLRSMGTL